MAKKTELKKRGTKSYETIYEEWCDENHDRIMDELEQSGATRELDFDLEREFEVRFEQYCET